VIATSLIVAVSAPHPMASQRQGMASKKGIVNLGREDRG